MLFKRTALITLISLSFLGIGAIATAQRQSPIPSHLTIKQSACPSAMSHRGRMRGGMMPMQLASEFDYLNQMIPHHQEAIDTAQIILERSNRSEMREFAQDIIDVQSTEIEQMQAWLNEWYPDRPSALLYTPMMRDLRPLEGDALDQTFLEDMISHHHMAVMMSHMLVHRGFVEHEALRPFSERIASSQRNEIHQMQAWLNEWFDAPSGCFEMGRMQVR
ncbi:DUF305 domain-containing protein [Oscillatoria sp. FACHB-1407]|nr:DUF305 domain-containing protein [Oscillatoria sp. FACHB-1407]